MVRKPIDVGILCSNSLNIGLGVVALEQTSATCGLPSIFVRPAGDFSLPVLNENVRQLFVKKKILNFNFVLLTECIISFRNAVHLTP